MSKRKDVVKEQAIEVSKPASVIEADKKVVQTEDERDLALEDKVIDIVGQHTEDPNVRHEDLEKTMKEDAKKKGKKGQVSTETKTEEPKPTCAECKWYDVSTEREFHRDGIREGLVETRSICRAPKDVSKASGHLVKRESTRPCVQSGVYAKPVKEKKTKKEQPAETQAETKTVETHTQTPAKTKTSKKHRGTERAVATNSLSGDTKVLETNGHDKKVFVKNIA